MADDDREARGLVGYKASWAYIHNGPHQWEHPDTNREECMVFADAVAAYERAKWSVEREKLALERSHAESIAKQFDRELAVATAGWAVAREDLRKICETRDGEQAVHAATRQLLGKAILDIQRLGIKEWPLGVPVPPIPPMVMTAEQDAVMHDDSRHTPGKEVMAAEIDMLRGALAGTEEELVAIRTKYAALVEAVQETLLSRSGIDWRRMLSVALRALDPNNKALVQAAERCQDCGEPLPHAFNFPCRGKVVDGR